MIDYKRFIEETFYLKNKDGLIVPFYLNEVQDSYNTQLITDYPDMIGIRENDLKGRQFGISTFIAAIFTTDFIYSSLGLIPLTDSDMYSHKDKETRAHFKRVNMFLDSWLLKDQGGSYLNPEHRKELPALRKSFLRTDSDSGLIVSNNGTELQTATAGAKVSGRGNTRANLHWSEIAFYPNTQIMSAENLVVGAEEQVPQGRGKIFRESTGNLAADYFAREYKLGKDGMSEFKSRFMAWYTHKEYKLEAPVRWEAPEYYFKLLADGQATLNQCFWHFTKTRGLTDKKKLREYPTYDTEAFLYGGDPWFNAEALLRATNSVQKPIKEADYVLGL
ncbi:MAG TPA: hypothetical protein VJ841_03520 [Candidatus Saccharimonadales bacterium]|nr:hypothetical protein [Candidatus Saccharimonadales bacterium]